MITIFNGRRRTAGQSDSSIYVQMDVSLRDHLHLFNNGKNLNPYAVFSVIALHADSNGWAWPGFERVMECTGITQRKTLRAALRHMLQTRIDGDRVIQIYKRVENGEHRGYVFHIFPDAGGGHDCPSSLTGDISVWYPDIDDEEGGGVLKGPTVGSLLPQGGVLNAPPKDNHEVEPSKHMISGANAPEDMSESLDIAAWTPSEVEPPEEPSHADPDDPWGDNDPRKPPKWSLPIQGDEELRRAWEACGGRTKFLKKDERERWLQIKSRLRPDDIPHEWLNNCITYVARTRPMGFNSLLSWVLNHDKMTDWLQNWHRKKAR